MAKIRTKFRIKRRLDVEQLKPQIRELFVADMDRLAIEFQETLGKRIFSWPNETKRKNGETVTSPRDIIDTRALYDGFLYNLVGTRKAKFEWTAEHSAAVHNGAVFKSGTTLTARPWVWVTIRDFYPLENFEKT